MAALTSRARLAHTTFALVLVLATSAALAQEARRGERTIIVNELDLNLTVPNSPALVVLGLSIDTVVRPTSPKELAAAVQNGLDRNGNFQSGAALDFNPWMVFNGIGNTEAGILLSEYLEGDTTLWRELFDDKPHTANLWRSLLYRTQISFATTKGVTSDDDSVRVAGGAKVTPFDNGDPILLTGKCIRTTIARQENFSTSLVDPLTPPEGGPSVPPLGEQLDAVIRSAGKRIALRGDESMELHTARELKNKVGVLPLDKSSAPVLALTEGLKTKFRLTGPRRQIVVDLGMMTEDELEQLKDKDFVDVVTPRQLEELIQQHKDWKERHDQAETGGQSAAAKEITHHHRPPTFVLTPDEQQRIRVAEMDKAMQLLVDELASEIERGCKSDVTKNEAWNRSAWDLAIAPAWFGESGSYKDLKWNGGAAWTSLALGWDTFVDSDEVTDAKGAADPDSNWDSILRNWIHFILHARYRFDEKQSAATLNVPDDFFEADSWLIGGRGRFGGPKFSLSFEGAYVRQNSETHDVEDDTIYRLAIIPSLTFRGFTIEATIGTDANRKGKNPAFVLSSIKWSLPSPNSPP